MPTQLKQQKHSSKTSQKDPLRHQVSLKERGHEIYTSRQCKSILKGDVIVIEATHVLSFPLTISIQRSGADNL